ncbi:MAG: DUF551 domain-containing protein [Lachnospiraceae bacterium]
MTKEEAIRLLDPQTTREALAEIEYYAGFNGKDACIKAIEDACILAIDALEKQEIYKWIPVSERLPKEDYDLVLVFLESNIYDIAIWHSEYGFRPWYVAYFEESTPEWESKVLAWMPLPEPYGGEVKE